jgi:hypothetical protein
MSRRLFSLLLVIVFVGIFASSPSQPAYGATVYTKDNGVIRIKLNESSPPYGHWPMITSMYINGREIVPNYGVGANFQMTTRSYRGNAYNPTQGGNCRGDTSVLTGVIPNFANPSLGTGPTNGILLGVDPRDYNPLEPNNCNQSPSAPPAQVGQILPYNFNFSATLGDGVQFPKQAMVVGMSVQRESGSEEVVQRLSELPVIFARASFMHYAYWSPDNINYFPLTYNGTHDTNVWPSGTIVERDDVKVLMISSSSDAHTNPSSGVGMAIYSNFTTTGGASPRQEPTIRLLAFGLVGSNNLSSNIPRTDFNWYTLNRIVAVGNLGTIRTAIDQTRTRIGGTGWGNWTP